MKHNYERNRTDEQAFADPLAHVGNHNSGCRYKAFLLNGNEYTAYFLPHHNVYHTIHAAVRWGIYQWNCGGKPFEVKRFVLDLWNGQIVWQNFDDTKTDTYKFKNIGANYTTY